MGGLVPKANTPIHNSLISSVLEGSQAIKVELRHSEGLRVVVSDDNGKLTVQSPGEPCPLAGLSQEMLCEDVSAIQELYARGKSGSVFGWSFLGFEVKASIRLMEIAEELLRKEGLIYVRYGLMNLPLGVSLDLSTNHLPSGDAISHPLWLPESWFATPWEARIKAQEISDVIQSMTGEPVNISACYAYFCLAELSREQKPSGS